MAVCLQLISCPGSSALNLEDVNDILHIWDELKLFFSLLKSTTTTTKIIWSELCHKFTLTQISFLCSAWLYLIPVPKPVISHFMDIHKNI